MSHLPLKPSASGVLPPPRAPSPSSRARAVERSAVGRGRSPLHPRCGDAPLRTPSSSELARHDTHHEGFDRWMKKEKAEKQDAVGVPQPTSYEQVPSTLYQVYQHVPQL